MCLTPGARAQESVLPPQAQRYEIAIRFDPSTHSIRGRESITWRNESVRPQDALYFHLYLNAFEDDGTVFMRESGGLLRGIRAGSLGEMVLSSLRVDGAERLPQSDDALIFGDRTQLRVPLLQAIAPGEEAQIEIEWRARLPEAFARSGYKKDFFVVAQFFPKLARLEPSGEWATFPYHGNAEFYADFADYDLRIDAPSDWVIAASGIEQRREGSVRHFRARAVHDCVFAAAPWLQETRRTHTRSDGSTIAIRLFSPPGFASADAAHLRTAQRGLTHFGQMLGEYPYDALTIVVPPEGAEGVAGMEYPTFFVTGGAFFGSSMLPFAAHETTAHELGHQWFQGLVATNEAASPILDEGLTEWLTVDLLDQLFGERASGVNTPLYRESGFARRRRWAAFAPPTPLASPAHAFRSFNDYGAAIYGKAPVLFEEIAERFGRERFTRALGRYARRHRFGHPTLEDLLSAMDHEYGGWMSREWLRPALEHDTPLPDTPQTSETGATEPPAGAPWYQWLLSALLSP